MLQLHGAYRISGHLTAAEGEEVAAILNAHAEWAWKRQSEDSTGAPTGKAQLLADALLVVVRGHAALSLAPAHGGDRPRVTVLLDLDALRTGLGLDGPHRWHTAHRGGSAAARL